MKDKPFVFKSRVLVHTLTLAGTIFTCVALQANEHDNKDQQRTAGAPGSSASSSSRQLADKETDFVKEALKGNMMEMKMGQMGADKAQNQELKQFGETLVKDHSRANEELRTIAQKKGVELPTEVHKNHDKKMDNLPEQAGAEWDKAFARHMVKDHKKDIKKYEQASRDCKDQELKAYIDKTLPTLRQHLQTAQSIARNLGVDVTNIEADVDASGSAPETETDRSKDSSSIQSDSSIRADVDADVETSSTLNRNTSDGKTLGIDFDRNQSQGSSATVETSTGSSAQAEADLDVDNDKNDGKTLGIDFDRNQSRGASAEVEVDADRSASADADVNLDTDKNDGKTLGVDLDRNQSRTDVDVDSNDASIKADVDVDTDKNDGETLGVKTEAHDGETLGVETKEGDGRTLGIKTVPGDGKTLGLNTSKTDGKLLGIFPAPGRNNDAEIEADADVDVDNGRVSADASVDTDATGAPATSSTERNNSAATSTDADQQLTLAEVPQEVRRSIQAQAGTQDVQTVRKHKENGKVCYEVEVRKDGQTKTLKFDEKGKMSNKGQS
ncbi:MAG: DUF4142 domain-containing protein [Verrucomicrobiota bacterium]|nr:DUF4142 domain-containing protein [Verrucomicrobiota bacterium]